MSRYVIEGMVWWAGDNVTYGQIENFKERIYNGVVDENDILQVTRRVGDEIAKVYGWEIRGLNGLSLFY